MNLRIKALKFRYAGQDRADAAEIKRMLEDCPFEAERIDTKGPYAEVRFTGPVIANSPGLDRFVKRMDEYHYRLGFNNES